MGHLNQTAGSAQCPVVRHEWIWTLNFRAAGLISLLSDIYRYFRELTRYTLIPGTPSGKSLLDIISSPGERVTRWALPIFLVIIVSTQSTQWQLATLLHISCRPSVPSQLRRSVCVVRCARRQMSASRRRRDTRRRQTGEPQLRRWIIPGFKRALAMLRYRPRCTGLSTLWKGSAEIYFIFTPRYFTPENQL